MSDTNFRRGSPDYTEDLGARHPRGSGMSYGSQRRHDEQGYMEQASDMADDAWRTGREYYDQGSRRVSEWASDHPNQLWAAIAVAGAFALWMAYRPMFSGRSRSNFDASRYRYRRLPQTSGRSEFMERGGERGGRGY